MKILATFVAVTLATVVLFGRNYRTWRPYIAAQRGGTK